MNGEPTTLAELKEQKQDPRGLFVQCFPGNTTGIIVECTQTGANLVMAGGITSNGTTQTTTIWIDQELITLDPETWWLKYSFDRRALREQYPTISWPPWF